MPLSPISILCTLLLLKNIEAAIGDCWEPGPAFPPPEIDAAQFKSSQLAQKFDTLILDALNSNSSDWSWENSSFAIQLTSSSETLWSSYYTAPSLGNYSDGSPTPVSGDTAFRIASCSKTFTVYALLLEKGIGLEDPITKYLPELNGERDKHWGIRVDWDGITIRSLASQMSGIGRGIGNADLAVVELDIWDPVSRGLPEIASNDTYLKPCMNGTDERPCTKAEMIIIAKNMHPIFSPNDRSTYSNIAYSLLGFALENVTGQEYSEIIKSRILGPLHMSKTTLTKPNDSDGIIPVGPTDWYQDLGPNNPSGGIYTTANDLSKYLRSILTSSLLPKSTTNYWMKPHSWTSSRTNSAYGMPREILRTTKATPDSHPTDIITKGGSLGGYYSTIALLPEYGIGISILTATPSEPVEFHLRDLLIAELIHSFDKLARKIAKERYKGFYGSRNEFSGPLDDSSSIELDIDDGPGLLLKKWTLNNTDFLPTYGFLNEMPEDPEKWEARLIPTNSNFLPLNSDDNDDKNNDDRPEKSLLQETWRLTAVLKDKGKQEEEGSIFDDYCFTDVDGLVYGGWSLEEFVFQSSHGRDGMDRVILPGARTMLFKVDGEGDAVLGSKGDREEEQQILEKKRMVKFQGR